VFLMLTPVGGWAQSVTCHQGSFTLRGQYVLRSTGTMAGNPFAAVGKESYDGQGNFQLTGTASFNGTIYRGLSGTGTYTVNPDCTGLPDVRLWPYGLAFRFRCDSRWA
jgi:hypothetical protein